MAAIFDDSYHLVDGFTLARFEHCNRDADKVSRELARLARFSLMLDWLEKPSIEIVTILIHDLAVTFHK